MKRLIQQLWCPLTSAIWAKRGSVAISKNVYDIIITNEVAIHNIVYSAKSLQFRSKLCKVVSLTHSNYFTGYSQSSYFNNKIIRNPSLGAG